MPSEMWDEITYPFPNLNGVIQIVSNVVFITEHGFNEGYITAKYGNG